MVHILIDCGNKFGSLDVLGRSIAALKAELPVGRDGKRQLDLLVVSHPHEDHHKGFEEDFFKEIHIERIWLSPAFNLEDPKAATFQALKATALRALNFLAGQAAGDMQVQAEELLRLSKDEAIEMLCHTLPEKNGIQAQYVTADTPADRLKIFRDPRIALKVLGPMSAIDATYLGGEGLANTRADADTPQGMAAGYQALYLDPGAVEVAQPKNISRQDFELLRGRIHANALAVAELAGHAENNLSVVLLLEWHGRRLLFPGDAEWNPAADGAVRQGRSNGSWNVMWKERQENLATPVDFLKVGHHGSWNATPWKPPDAGGNQHPINQILDHLLPRPGAGERPRGAAIVSTQRTERWPSIPNAPLMEELGRRVINARPEYEEPKGPKAVKAHIPQPQRTDLEEQFAGPPVAFIEMLFDPAA
jgi:hypothetical protein